MSFDSRAKIQDETPCGWAEVDGSSCSLISGHLGLHEFTIPPPDEYWEEEGKEDMKLPKDETKPLKHSITLTFTGDDASLYEEIVTEAKNDRRTPSQYLLLYLSKNHNVKEN